MSTDCVIWTGHIRPRDGYGIHYTGRMAHRVLWEREHGLIPDGMELDHRCETRACVNLAHLEVVDRSENVRRSKHWSRAKMTCPEGHPYDAVWGGKRYCRTCRRAKERARRAALRRETCKKGHSYDTIDARGSRRCSICMAAAGKIAMAARWAAADQ